MLLFLVIFLKVRQLKTKAPIFKLSWNSVTGRKGEGGGKREEGEKRRERGREGRRDMGERN